MAFRDLRRRRAGIAGDGPAGWSQIYTRTTQYKVDRTQPIFLATWMMIPAFNNYTEVNNDRLTYL